MATAVEELFVRLGWKVSSADKSRLGQYEASLDKILKASVKLGKAVGVAAGSLAGMTILANRATAKQANLAAAVGISAEKIDALGSAVAGIGFDYIEVLDLVEELNNKFGEFELTGMTSVKESLQLLGLEFKELKALAPEDQFIRIMDAAKGLDDQQVAVSAVDILMGGNANKVMGHLRNLDGSLGDIVARYTRLNFLTQEGRDGAVESSRAVGELAKSAMSMFQEFSGLLGAALAPVMEQLSQWIMMNRDLIKQKISAFVDEFRRTLSWLAARLPFILRLLAKIPALFKLLIGVLGGAALLKGILVLKRLSRGLNAVGNEALKAQLKMMLIVAVIAFIVLLIEDFYTFLEGGESYIGDLVEKLEEWLGFPIAEPMREYWQILKDIVKDIPKIWDEAILIVEGLIKSAVDTYTGWSQAIRDFFTKAADFISDAWDKAVGKILGFAKKIPFLGDLIGGDADITVSGGTTAAGMAAGTSAGTSVLNNKTSTTKVTNSTNVNVGGITVKAQQGQSPGAIARAVRKELGSASAKAVQANNTGVAY